MSARIFVAEITPTVAADGSTATYLFATESFATRPGDTPANTGVPGLLRNAGTLRRELFSGARVAGAVRSSYGNLVLANPLRDADGAGDLDDWLGYSVSGARIVVRWGQIGTAYPSAWTTVYIAYGHSLLVDVDSVTIRLRDRLQLLEAPAVTDGFAGTGGLEGTGGVSRRKQQVYGDPAPLPPVLVDVNEQIWFCHPNCPGSSIQTQAGLAAAAGAIEPFDVFDNGVKLTRVADYTSEAELLADAPAAGEVRWWFGPVSSATGRADGPCWFRLGAAPDGDLRVYANGEPTAADAARTGRVLGSFYAGHLAARAGVDAASLPDAAYGLPVGSLLVDDDRSYLDVLTDAAAAIQGFFGFDRLDRFRAGYLLDPESNRAYYGVPASIVTDTASPTTSLYTFDETIVKGLRREPPSGAEVPVWKVTASVGQTWPSQIDSAASATLKDYLSREPAWTSVQGVSTSTLLAHPGAQVVTLQIAPRAVQNTFAAQLFCARFLALYGGARDFFSFASPMSDELLALDLHDVVTLQTPRFGLAAGRKHRIVGITLDCSTAVPLIRFLLWGGTPGTYTGGSGGPGSVPPSTGTPPSASAAALEAAYAAIGAFTGVSAGYTEVAAGDAAGDYDDPDPPPGGGTGLGLRRELIGLFSGVSQGYAAPETDADFASVSLLAHFNGTDGQTSADDDGPIGHTLTRVGTPEIDTAQSVLGGASSLFPRTGSGSGDKWTIAADASFNLSADFTIEFRFRTTSASTGQTILRCEGDSGTGWEILMNNLGNIYFSWINSGTPLAQYSGLVANTWYAIAFQRSGSTISHHIDGSYGSAATSTDSSTMTGNGALAIGGRSGSTSLDMTGWLDELRITKGVARYGATNYTVRTTEFPNA